MTNKNKVAGTNFEHRVIHLLRKKGFYTVRAGSSLGTFDILAVKDGIAFGFQCKYSKNGKLYVPKVELENMINEAMKNKFYAILVYNKKQKEEEKGKMTFRILYAPDNGAFFRSLFS
jgi:Holliday junction resolvase